MKRINDSYLNEHLKRAVEKLLPDMAEQIWERPVEKASGDEWYLDGVTPKKHSLGKTIAWISPIAACLVLCFLTFHMINFQVDATIYLDVNPAITLNVNRNEHVIRAEANNRDGEIVLEDMKLKNTDLNTAVNAIFGSMVKHGYLGETNDVVLLSVKSGSTKKTEALRTQLSEEINTCLTSLIGSGSVYDQGVEDDDNLESLAAEYNITPGKAALLQKVTAANPELDYSSLAELSVNDLTQYLSQTGIDLRDYANYSEAASYNNSDSEDERSPNSDEDSYDMPHKNPYNIDRSVDAKFAEPEDTVRGIEGKFTEPEDMDRDDTEYEEPEDMERDDAEYEEPDDEDYDDTEYEEPDYEDNDDIEYEESDYEDNDDIEYEGSDYGGNDDIEYEEPDYEDDYEDSDDEFESDEADD